MTRIVGAGTVFRHEQAGGGGWGDPLERDLRAIAADLVDGKIGREFAAREHGVVFAGDGDAIDAAASASERWARNTARSDPGRRRKP